MSKEASHGMAAATSISGPANGSRTVAVASTSAAFNQGRSKKSNTLWDQWMTSSGEEASKN